MCGIVGYIGNKDATKILMDGLKRLEYRGYDSAGIAILNNGSISVLKEPGKISGLEKAISENPVSGTIGIAHTRWATHGSPNKTNAHPHTDFHNKIALIHNGIIENYQSIKTRLKDGGYEFRTETDTEALANLISEFYKNGTPLEEAVRDALSQVEGTFGIVVLAHGNW